MLKLENITKDYLSGDTKVTALKGINIEFRSIRKWKNNLIKYNWWFR